jgi:outer membrane protein assembly factor BamB
MGNLPPMPEPGERPARRWLAKGWLRWLLALAGVVAAVIIAAVVVVLVHKPHNVSHPNLSFTATTATTTAAKPRLPKPDNFAWATYGYNFARTRAFTADADLHPPFKHGWILQAGGSLEFPPVIFGRTLWFMNDNATVKSVNATTGHLNWQFSIGKLSSASPALAVKQRILVVPTLSDTSKTPGNGQVVAMSMLSGKILWHHPLPSGAEGSAIVSRNTVFYGDQDGHVYSANVKTGHINWVFQASGAVKGGAALNGNNLYVDDYGGKVYDIDPRNGHQIWESSADGGDLGFSSGNFYSTPTVAFGRVYVGNTSGYVYSFAAGTGQLAWSYGTGNYVYSSAAVANVPGLGPTVYMGSYNGDFYAFNAQSGAIRWVHRDAHDNRISGSATVVNGVVYYSDLDDRLTTGLDARTGKVVFTFNDGAFSPVVADPSHIYLSGGYTLYELLPNTPARSTTANTTAKRRAAARTKAAKAKAARTKAAKAKAAKTRARTVKPHAVRHRTLTAAQKRALARRHAVAKKRAAARLAARKRAAAKLAAKKRAAARQKRR